MRPKLTQIRLQGLWFAMGDRISNTEGCYYDTREERRRDEAMEKYVRGLRKWWEEKNGRDLFAPPEGSE